MASAAPQPASLAACRAAAQDMIRDKVASASEADVVALETSIYHWSLKRANDNKIVKNWDNPRFVRLYGSKARSIVLNLDPNSYVGNARLCGRWLEDKEFDAAELSDMPPATMFPDRWMTEMDAKMKRDEHIYEDKRKSMTELYKCSRCKRRECVYQELQLRSADEPMSIFITCLTCGHRWRLG